MKEATAGFDGKAAPLVMADGDSEFDYDAEGRLISQVRPIDGGEIRYHFYDDEPPISSEGRIDDDLAAVDGTGFWIEYGDLGNLLTGLLPDRQPGATEGEIPAELFISHWRHFDPTPGRWVGADRDHRPIGPSHHHDLRCRRPRDCHDRCDGQPHNHGV